MALYSYLESQTLSATDPSFDALIMAAIRKADTFNAAQLELAFPEIFEELRQRYNAPGGRLEGEEAANAN